MDLKPEEDCLFGSTPGRHQSKLFFSKRSNLRNAESRLASMHSSQLIDSTNPNHSNLQMLSPPKKISSVHFKLFLIGKFGSISFRCIECFEPNLV